MRRTIISTNITEVKWHLLSQVCWLVSPKNINSHVKHVWRRRNVILRKKNTWWVTPAARRPVRWNKSFCWLCSRAATHRLWLQHKVTLAPVCLPTKRYKLACADRWRRPRRCTAEEPQLVCNLFRGVSIGRQMSACHAIFFMWSRDALTVLCL